MPLLLTFGDSNTHGTPPMADRETYARFGPTVRWPGVARQHLGPAWELVEEGLPGRTAQFDDPGMDGLMNGHPALRQALQSHGPIDVLTIMLGTNDVKTRFGASPETIMGGIAGLLDLASSAEMQTRHGGFRVLLICPPRWSRSACWPPISGAVPPRRGRCHRCIRPWRNRAAWVFWMRAM
ncbi:GDSL-type esterase/lipase family protein [Gemmobacter lanyuensis]